MKKIIVCIFMFISLIGYILSFENVSIVYDSSIAVGPEQSNRIASFLILSNEFTKNNESEISKRLLELCEKNHVSILKTSPIDQYHVKKYVYMAENIYENAALDLSAKQMNSFNKNIDVFITNDFNKKADLYFPYFSDEQKYYIYNYQDYDYIDGSYTLIGENAKEVLKDFKNSFPDLVIEAENYLAATIAKDIMHSPRMRSFVQLIVILLVIAIVCMLMFFSRIEEKLSIKKMFGYSSFRLMIKENWRLILDVIIASILIFTICLVCTVKEFNSFILLLLQYLMIFLVFELVMLFVILVFLFYFFKKVQIVQVLKHKTNFKSLLTLNIILRVIIVVLGIFIIGEYFKPMLADFHNVLSYSDFIEKSKGFYSATNMQRFEKDLPGYLETLYDQVNQSGGIGVEKGLFQDWDSGQQISFYEINEKFLDYYSLKDTDGKNIKVKGDKFKILASKKNINTAKKLMELYSDSGYDTKLIRIASDQKIFTFDNDINEGGVGFAYDPIIVVSDFINPWFVYLKESQIDKDAYDKALRNKGYEATFDINAANDRSKLLYDMWLQALLQEVILISISFLALCAVIAQYVMAYIYSFKKSIAIKKTMGYSLLKRYDNMIMIMSFFYFVIWSYCFIWGRPLIEQVTVLIMFIFECILSLLLVAKNERRITAESLKE